MDFNTCTTDYILNKNANVFSHTIILCYHFYKSPPPPTPWLCVRLFDVLKNISRTRSIIHAHIYDHYCNISPMVDHGIWWNWKCHVIIVIKTDPSGFVVTMHSGLCEQYVKSLGLGIWFPVSYAPFSIVTTNPSRTGLDPWNQTGRLYSSLLSRLLNKCFNAVLFSYIVSREFNIAVWNRSNQWLFRQHWHCGYRFR